MINLGLSHLRLKRDLYAGRNALLAKGEGADTSTVLIPREYGKVTSWSTSGDAKVRTDTPLFTGYGSYAFDGTGDFFRGDNFGAIGAADFALECWATCSTTVAAVQCLISNTTGGTNTAANNCVILYFFNGTFEAAFYQGAGAPLAVITSGSGMTDGTRRHVRTGRVGSTVYLAVNGTVVDTDTAAGALNSTANGLYLGAHGQTAGLYLNGRIDFPRVRTGYGFSTSNFTVPTFPFPAY